MEEVPTTFGLDVADMHFTNSAQHAAVVDVAAVHKAHLVIQTSTIASVRAKRKGRTSVVATTPSASMGSSVADF